MKTRIAILTAGTCLAASMLAQAQPSSQARSQIDEVVALVEANFYDADAVSGTAWKDAVKRLRDQADQLTGPDALAEQVNALLATLKTSHTHYYPESDPKRYQLLGVFQALYGPGRDDLFLYDGIGIDSRVIDGHTVIVSVFDGLPAHAAGLQVGDRIRSVDGSMFHPIDSFKGRVGQRVHIQLQRHGRETNVHVPVVALDGRTMFEAAAAASVRTIDYQGNRLGYIHLWSYAGSQYQELLREQILWGDLSQCAALVLDLRDGWGGADLNYLNLFRPPIATTSYRDRNGSTGSYSGVWEKPVALLVNERTTSGKELLAYGFQKLQLGPVVGSRTAGAVVGGRIFLLSNGDVLYLAVRDIMVDGQRLEGKGVEPDISVDRSLSPTTSEDPQLRRAVQEVAKRIKAH